MTLSACDNEIKEQGKVIGKITETVGDGNLRPASGLVELEGSENYKVYATANWDNSEGEYEMVGGTFAKKGVKEGSYKMKVHKIGYETKTKEISISPNTTNDLGSVQLTLKDNFDKRDGLYMYVFNRNVEPFDDPAVREALGYAINREDYNSFLQPPGTKAANRILTPGTEGYTEKQITNEFNIDKAEEILTKAGYEKADSIDITISVIVWENQKDHLYIAREIKSYWNQIKQVRVEIDGSYSNFSNYESDFANDKIGIRYLAFLIDNPDPLFYLEALENFIGYDTEEKNYLEKAKLNLTNKNEALSYIYDLEEHIVNSEKVIPLHYLELNKN